MKKHTMLILFIATQLSAQTTQEATAFAFFLQNCFVGSAQKSCLNHAKATYHPPIIKQSNFNSSGDKVIQEASILEVVAQNCACLTGSNCCNGTMAATASAGPITQKVSDAGGHPNNLDLTGLIPTELKIGKQPLRLPIGQNVTDPKTNVTYYTLTPTTGPRKGQKIEIIFQNQTAYTKG